MVETYKITAKDDKHLVWMTVAGLVVPIIAFIILGFVLNSPLIWGMLGVSVGALVAMLLFAWRARRAASLHALRGQGRFGRGRAADAAEELDLDTGHTATRQLDAVHRTLGQGGLILIGEGDPGRLKQLLASERRRSTNRSPTASPSPPSRWARAPDRSRSGRLAKHIKKLPSELTPAKINEVNQRLRALDAMRPRPHPEGPHQHEGRRSAMRGRQRISQSRQPRAVTHGFGTRILLDGVSLGLGAGEVIGVVGHNGDGKTTLLRILTGDLEPDGGRVTHVDNASISVLAQGLVGDDAQTVRDWIVDGQARPRLGG